MFTVWIDGAQVEVERGTCVFSRSVVGRKLFDCVVISEDGSLTISDLDPILVYRTGIEDPVFKGFINNPRERGTHGSDPNDAVSFEVSAADQNVLPERRYVWITIPAGNLLAAMTALQPYLEPWGIEIAADQPDDDLELPELVFVATRLDKAIERLTLESGGYLSNIDANDEWRMALPGSVSAPWNIADGDGHVDGDLVLSQSTDEYANIVYVQGGTGTALDDHTQQFTQVGSETSYQTDRDASQSIADTFPNQVIVNGAIVAPAGWGPDQLPAGNWYWDYEAHTLVNGTGVSLSPGDVLTVTHAIAPLVRVQDDDAVAALGPFEATRSAPTATTYAQTVATAQAVLVSTLAARSKYAEYTTRDAGLEPGQAQTIDVARRHVNASFSIQTVRDVEDADGKIITTVTAMQGTAGLMRTYRDTYDRWEGNGSTASGGAVVAVSGGGSGGSGGSTGSKVVYPLAQETGLWVNSTDWVPFGGNEVVVDTDALGTRVGTVFVRLKAETSGITVRPRLYDLTNASVVGIASAVTFTADYINVEFNVTLATGRSRLRLEGLAGTSGKDINGLGYLQIG